MNGLQQLLTKISACAMTLAITCQDDDSSPTCLATSRRVATDSLLLVSNTVTFWILVDFGAVCPIGPMVSMAYFVTEMYSTHAWKVHNIPVRTTDHWNLRFIFFRRSTQVRSRWEQLAKYNSYSARGTVSAPIFCSTTSTVQTSVRKFTNQLP